MIRSPIDSCRFRGAPVLATPFGLWANDTDGSAAVFASNRSEKMAGWMLWETDGDYRSFCGINERLFCVVARKVGASTQYWLEEFDWGYACRADGCVTLTAETATTGWRSTEHGGNVALSVFDAETGAHVEDVVTDAYGYFIIGVALTSVMVGRPFVYRVETLPPAVQLQDGDQFGEVVGIGRSIVHFYETEYATVNGEAFSARDAQDVLAPVKPVTAFFESRHLGYGRSESIAIEGVSAHRFGVLGVLQEVKL